MKGVKLVRQVLLDSKIKKYNPTFDNQTGIISYSQFDSEEPLHILTDIIQDQKLDGKLLIGLNFKADEYDKGINFDFHVNQDTEGRVAMDAQTF